MKSDLTRDDMISGLRELVARLHAQNQPGGIRIIGGAAMSLRYYGDRRLTPDVDAKIHPADPAIRIAESIAIEQDWRPDWLNNKADGFIPVATAIDWEPLYDDDAVSVWVASPVALLAMKLNAARPGRDDQDIAILLALTGVTDADEAEAVFERHYPGELPPARAYAILANIFAKGIPPAPEPPPFPDLSPS